MADFASFAVPASNGSGAALAAPENIPRTIVVSGTFLGLVQIEGSTDGTSGWVPLVTFQKTDFKEITFPYEFLRVTRIGIPAVGTPGLPSVSIGCCVEAITTVILPAPVGLNGAGAAESVVGLGIEGVSMLGTFPAGAVVSVEISMDGTNWGPLATSLVRPGAVAIAAVAAWARMVVSGRVSAAALPQVAVAGTTQSTVTAVLTPPGTPNGIGATISTMSHGSRKTVIFASPSGDIPGQITVQGSNDGGTSWCAVLASNVVGTRYINGTFQNMRMVTAGLIAPLALSVGIGSVGCVCELPEEGESYVDASIGGV